MKMDVFFDSPLIGMKVAQQTEHGIHCCYHGKKEIEIIILFS